MFDNKKIAKNTIFLYVQVVVQAVIGLFTSRLVLQSLGSSDFGLYGVVGGIIALFSVISGAMSNTTTRFLNIELGKNNSNVNKIFNVSLILHIATALIIVVFSETIGIFYINNYLNVESGKESDAMFVFQLSLIITCIGLTFIPFKALLFAYERFKDIAFIEIANTIVKLLFVLMLFIYRGNSLRFYAVAMFLSSGLLFLSYHLTCLKRWPEVIKWNLVKKWNPYKEQLAFSNWSLVGGIALMGRSQGSHLLINYFFGTIANAAYSISLTVQGYVNVLADNFSKSAMPQITQQIGKGEYQKSVELLTDVCRFHLILMEVVFFSLYVELDFLLHIWLGSSIPPETLEFCRLTLIVAIVSSTGSGIITIINAYGKIKWFKIQSSLWFLSCLPAGLWAYKTSLPSYSILLFFIIADIGNRTLQLILLRLFYNLDVIQFVKKAWTRPSIVLLLMFLFMHLYHLLYIENAWAKFCGILITFVFTCVLCVAIGLHRKERNLLTNYICRKLGTAN